MVEPGMLGCNKKAKTAFNRFKKHNTIENKIEHNKRKAISHPIRNHLANNTKDSRS